MKLTFRNDDMKLSLNKADMMLMFRNDDMKLALDMLT